ncbi:DNA-binding transcriptional regulator, FrmR family [Thermanaeromonas toyohensis ToBE]|uniref:DNA-binding transcriptional regulator, FrmR family n=1 Tax=Thermanaeromonas toyohensis ToBE TaxID=698762 RepID=A0A1W1VZQ5_9FIRM|nr:metal-sensitive transcriptional regulator [Thermanaeromonas toyohensis]SMB98837.1 DNA-binding transcriptional regulator, FrmR family [Thermanaeromonas toyohensis ToBE]
MSSYAPVKDELLLRLRRIEGQVKGLQRMVEEGKYCVDVLTQIAAVRAALKTVGTIIFEHHVRGCVRNAIVTKQGDEVIEELIDILNKFMD